MRVYTRIGDIYEVYLSSGKIAYFQLIAKDGSQLFSDVIRVFKTHYNSRPSLKAIIQDDIDCYLHTFVRIGTKYGFWNKIGNLGTLGSLDIWFRDSLDYGNYPRQIVVSKNWVVWKLNEERVFVGSLPKEYQSVDIGLIEPPENIIYRIVYGRNERKFYPLF